MSIKVMVERQFDEHSALNVDPQASRTFACATCAASGRCTNIQAQTHDTTLRVEAAALPRNLCTPIAIRDIPCRQTERSLRCRNGNSIACSDFYKKRFMCLRLEGAHRDQNDCCIHKFPRSNQPIYGSAIDGNLRSITQGREKRIIFNAFYTGRAC